MSGGDCETSSYTRDTDWRQGSVVDKADTVAVLAAAVDRPPETESDAIRLVVVTQDCDILAEPGKEPFVELIAGLPVDSPDPSRCHGRNPRLLDLPFTSSMGVVLRFSAHDKFRVRKASLAGMQPAADMSLGSDERYVLRGWIAKRYTRAAFPDELMRRLGDRKKQIDRVLKMDDAKHASAIYIHTTTEELAAGEDYEMKVRITAPTDMWDTEGGPAALLTFEEKLAGALSACSGITPVEDIETMPESDFSIDLLRLYKRFDVDYRSPNDDSAASLPPDGVDR